MSSAIVARRRKHTRFSLATIAALAAAATLLAIAAPPAGAFGFLNMWGKNGGLGGQGTGDNEFVLPWSVAFGPAPDHDVYVLDKYDCSVRVFKQDGTFLRRWGGTCKVASGYYGSPTDIQVDANGNVYVSDAWRSAIVESDANGSFLHLIGDSSAFAAEGGIGFVTGFALGTQNPPHLYIADLSYNRVDEMIADGTATGTFVRMYGWGVQNGLNSFQVCTAGCQTGLQGSGNGEFSYPAGVSLGPSNALYVADAGNYRVQQFNSATGAYVSKFSVANYPSRIETDPSGTSVWIASQIDDVVKRYSTGGVLQKTVGTDSVPSGDAGQLMGPDGLRFAPDGTLWIADTYNHRMQQFDATGTTSLQRWGKNGGIGSAVGSGDGQFDNVDGLSARGNRVAVADSGNVRVQVFDGSGNFTGIKFGSFGSLGGQFYSFGPTDTAIAPNGDIYTTEYGGNRIQRFDSQGNFIEAIGWDVDTGGGAGFEECTVAANCKTGAYGTGDGEFDGPWAIAFSPDGKLYVADDGNHRVQVLDPANHFALIRKIGKNGGDGTAGTGDGEFNQPNGIAFDAQGDFYVSDYGLDAVQKFAPDGSFVKKWGSFGTQPGQFQGLSGIAVTPNGQVHVTDKDNDRIQVFDPDGNLLSQYGGFGSDPGQMNNPTGIASDENGTIYVADDGNYRVQRWGDALPSAPLAVTLKPAKVKRFKRSVKATVSCTKACSFTLTATVKSGRKKLRAKTKGSLAAAGSKTVTLKFSKKNAKKVQSLIKRHKKPKIAFALNGTSGPETASASASLKLKK